jgi:enoyl-CoA hydratase/carnithine racemase
VANSQFTPPAGDYFITGPAVSGRSPNTWQAQLRLPGIWRQLGKLSPQYPKPVLAAINGPAIRGGITLPLAVADQVYLSEHAWARFPFANLGISAEPGSTYMLPRLLDMHKAKELFFFPDKLEAQQLLDLGLANALLPHDELLPYTRNKALQLIPPRGAGASIRAMKRVMHQQQVDALTRALDLENEALKQLMKSEDFVEGLIARMEKREPGFKGRWQLALRRRAIRQIRGFCSGNLPIRARAFALSLWPAGRERCRAHRGHVVTLSASVP